MSILNKTVLAAALALAGAGAQATVTYSGVATTSGGDADLGTLSAIGSYGGSAFNNTAFLNADDLENHWYFQLSGPAKVSVLLIDSPATIPGIGTLANDPLTFKVWAGSHGSTSNAFQFGGGEGAGTTFAALTGGLYHIDVSGLPTGTLGGSYALSVTLAPVPEPETYAMMLAGLGAIGFMARRRKAA